MENFGKNSLDIEWLKRNHENWGEEFKRVKISLRDYQTILKNCDHAPPYLVELIETSKELLEKNSIKYQKQINQTRNLIKYLKENPDLEENDFQGEIKEILNLDLDLDNIQEQVDGSIANNVTQFRNFLAYREGKEKYDRCLN